MTASDHACCFSNRTVKCVTVIPNASFNAEDLTHLHCQCHDTIGEGAEPGTKPVHGEHQQGSCCKPICPPRCLHAHAPNCAARHCAHAICQPQPMHPCGPCTPEQGACSREAHLCRVPLPLTASLYLVATVWVCQLLQHLHGHMGGMYVRMGKGQRRTGNGHGHGRVMLKTAHHHGSLIK